MPPEVNDLSSCRPRARSPATSMALLMATFVLRVSTSAVGSADASPSNDPGYFFMLGSAGHPAHVLHTRPSLCAPLVQNDTPETWALDYSPAEQLRGDGAVALEWITQAHAVSPAQPAPQTIWITVSAPSGDDEAPLPSPSNSSEIVAIQLTGISQCMEHERAWRGRPTATTEHAASLASSMLWRGLARHWNKITTALAVVLGLFIPYLQRSARCLLWELPPDPKPTSAPVNRVGKPHGKSVRFDHDSARPAQAHHGPSTQAGAHGSAQGGEWKTMSDDEIVERGSNGRIALYSLERVLEDPTRAVRIRRRLLSAHDATRPTSKGLAHSMLPYESYDYARVHGTCCENVIGVMPLPVGVAGPLSLDGEQLFLPMATTEGVLVASTNRGCNAINASGGVTTAVLKDGMTRGPVLRFPSLERATAAKRWLESSTGNQAIFRAFNSTSRFAKLQSTKSVVAGSDMFVRFQASTGDAMGMNMISKGVEASLAVLASSGFKDMQVVSLSGNYCSDKKSAAVNWIEGRGKSVCAQAVIKAAILQRVLKTDIDTLVELNTSKNLVGSALAGAVGGFNAHAANIVTAVFLATGQDAAQNVESSGCLTTMKKTAGGDLEISVTMPSVEVGTVGGGTTLEPQRAMLDLLGVQGANADVPGANAQRLACVVAGAVLAGELSLCSSLAAGSLVKSHMAHNRGNG